MRLTDRERYLHQTIAASQWQPRQTNQRSASPLAKVHNPHAECRDTMANRQRRRPRNPRHDPRASSLRKRHIVGRSHARTPPADAIVRTLSGHTLRPAALKRARLRKNPPPHRPPRKQDRGHGPLLHKLQHVAREARRVPRRSVRAAGVPTARLRHAAAARAGARDAAAGARGRWQARVGVPEVERECAAVLSQSWRCGDERVGWATGRWREAAGAGAERRRAEGSVVGHGSLAYLDDRKNFWLGYILADAQLRRHADLRIGLDIYSICTSIRHLRTPLFSPRSTP